MFSIILKCKGGGGGNDVPVTFCFQLFFALGLFDLHSCSITRINKKIFI